MSTLIRKCLFYDPQNCPAFILGIRHAHSHQQPLSTICASYH